MTGEYPGVTATVKRTNVLDLTAEEFLLPLVTDVDRSCVHRKKGGMHPLQPRAACNICSIVSRTLHLRGRT